jgi:hypothetical protein
MPVRESAREDRRSVGWLEPQIVEIFRISGMGTMGISGIAGLYGRVKLSDSLTKVKHCHPNFTRPSSE